MKKLIIATLFTLISFCSFAQESLKQDIYFTPKGHSAKRMNDVYALVYKVLQGSDGRYYFAIHIYSRETNTRIGVFEFLSSTNGEMGNFIIINEHSENCWIYTNEYGTKIYLDGDHYFSFKNYTP